MATNYRLVRTHLINAFLALENDVPEDERLRRAVELLLEAVAQTERDNGRSKTVRFPRQNRVVASELAPKRSGG